MRTRNRRIRRLAAGVAAITAALFTASARAADAPPADVPGRWPVERAKAWQADHGWLVGCNYLASTAVNQLEMFQADTFDLPTIDREMGYAQSLGFTCVRVFLQDQLYAQDPDGFLKRLDQFVATADRHGVGVMFVLFDSCWDPNPHLGRQRPPTPHKHNSGWVQSPGAETLRDPAKQDALRPYVTGVLGHFARDRRVLVWDLFNEQDNTNDNAYGTNGDHTDLPPPAKGRRALELMAKSYRWAREVNPDQPLTTCVWRGDWGDPSKLNPTDHFDLFNSDVITFHNYDDAAGMKRAIDTLRRYDRPVLCTEYMARPRGSTFAAILPLLKAEHVAAFNWGFVDGKSQTIYPWDSWEGKTYTAEPPVWFHDIFRHDGTPYRADEVAVIRRETGK